MEGWGILLFKLPFWSPSKLLPSSHGFEGWVSLVLVEGKGCSHPVIGWAPTWRVPFDQMVESTELEGCCVETCPSEKKRLCQCREKKKEKKRKKDKECGFDCSHNSEKWNGGWSFLWSSWRKSIQTELLWIWVACWCGARILPIVLLPVAANLGIVLFFIIILLRHVWRWIWVNWMG